MTNHKLKRRMSNTVTWLFLTVGAAVCTSGLWLLKVAAAAEPNSPKKIYLLRMMWLTGILLIGIIFVAVLLGFRRLMSVVKRKKHNKPTDTSSVWAQAGQRVELENEDDFSIDEMLSDD